MLWYNQRRYLHKVSFGAHSSSTNNRGQDEEVSTSRQVELCIQRETTELLQTIYESERSSSFDPVMLLNTVSANVICGMVMSKRFDHDDPQFRSFMDKFDEGFKLYNDTGAMSFLPVFKYVPSVYKSVLKLKRNHSEMMEFVRGIIEEHKSSLEQDNPKDLVDNYLIEIDNLLNNNDDKEKRSNKDLFLDFDPEHQLAQVVLDLFSAGVETVKTTIQWALLYMLHNPEVMKRIQQELEEVVGTENLPEWKDRPSTPYTHAAINEVLRISSVVPLGTTHSNDRDVELNGYTIPAGSHIIPHLHRVHHNPEHFPDPDAFLPERFLDESGKTVRRIKQFIPFGTGKRNCLGKWLAEKELYLIFSSILHVFDLRVPEGKPLPTMDSEAGVTVTPKKFEVDFRPRHVDALFEAKQKIILNQQSDLESGCEARTYG